MVGPLGGGDGDLRAPTIQHENVDGGPPWEAVSGAQEHPPPYVGDVDGGPLGPRGGSGLQPIS
jgi:hypothetical protein